MEQIILGDFYGITSFFSPFQDEKLIFDFFTKILVFMISNFLSEDGRGHGEERGQYTGKKW